MVLAAAANVTALAIEDPCATTLEQESSFGSDVGSLAGDLGLSHPKIVWHLTPDMPIAQSGNAVKLYMPTFETEFSVSAAKLKTFIESKVNEAARAASVSCGGIIDYEISATISVASHDATPFGMRSSLTGTGKLFGCIGYPTITNEDCYCAFGGCIKCPRIKEEYAEVRVTKHPIDGAVAFILVLSPHGPQLLFDKEAHSSLSDIERFITNALSVPFVIPSLVFKNNLFRKPASQIIEDKMSFEDSGALGAGGDVLRDADALITSVANEIDNEGGKVKSKDIKEYIEKAMQYRRVTSPIGCIDTPSLGRLCDVAQSARLENDRLSFSVVEMMDGQKTLDTVEGAIVAYATCNRFAALVNAIKKYKESSDDGLSYRALRGDSLWSLAARYYGGPGYYVALADFNGFRVDKVLHIGEAVRIPAFRTLIGASKIVQRGDSLWKIVGPHYRSVVPVNHQLTGPDIIYPGQSIRIRSP